MARGRPLCRPVSSSSTYALGTENEKLLAFVSIPDHEATCRLHQQLVQRLLPAQLQGTPFSASENPSPVPGEEFSGRRSRRARLLRRLNERHLEQPRRLELAARIAGYELAARMQMSISRSPISPRNPHPYSAYGADDPKQAPSRLCP